MNQSVKLLFFIFLLACWSINSHSQITSIYFNIGDHSVSDSSRVKLDSFYETYLQSNHPRVILKGYSDTLGTNQMNFDISKSRVNSVKTYLISKGFPVDNISVEPYGEENVKKDETWRSRRVDFFIDSNLTVYDYLSEIQKPRQIFMINNKKDTTIYGNEGTKIFIPSNTFKTLSGKNVYEIEIQLDEYYKVGDMLTSNLTTVTDKNEILETRGMINLTAKANGEECQIEKFSKISVSFPNIEDPEGFELYEGQESEEGVIWKSENTVAATEYKVALHLHGFTANEMGFKNVFADHLRENLYYPISALQKGVCGLLRIKFNMNTEGEIVEINFQDKGLYPVIDSLVLQTLKKMPKLTPAFKSNRRNLKHFYLCVIEFSSDKCKARYKTPPLMNPTWIIQNPVPSGPDSSYLANVNNISDVIYTTTNLGWLNLDKRIAFLGKRTSVRINYQPAYNVDFKIILSNSRSIVRASSVHNQYIFSGLTKNQKGVLIGLKYENNKIYLAKKEINIDKMTIENIDFVEVSVSELRKELMNL